MEGKEKKEKVAERIYNKELDMLPSRLGGFRRLGYVATSGV